MFAQSQRHLTLSRASIGQGPDGGVGLPRFYKVSRRRIPHWLSTAAWYSLCPAMPDRGCTQKNIVTDFRVALPESSALRSNDYKVTLASFTYAAHGTTCQTWQVRCTWPLSASWRAISILCCALTIAQRQPLLKLRAPQKRHHLMHVTA